MPGNSCAIAFCNNNSIAAKKDGKNISFHHFPKDDECRKIWIVRCRRKDEYLNPKTAVLCSEHFEVSDFQRNLKSELLGIPARKILKSTALPTRNIVAPKCKKKSPGKTSRPIIKHLFSEAIPEVEETPSVKSAEDMDKVEQQSELQKICVQQQETIEKLKKQLREATCRSNEQETSVAELEQRLNVTGKLKRKRKPAALKDVNNPDWAPSLNMSCTKKSKNGLLSHKEEEALGMHDEQIQLEPPVQEVDFNSDQETQELEESLRNIASNKNFFTDIKIKYLEEEHRVKMDILNIEKENAEIQNQTLKIEYEIKKAINQKMLEIDN